MKSLLERMMAEATLAWFKLTRPPRVLRYRSNTNIHILRTFGATVGTGCTVHSPIVLHHATAGYSNLVIGDRCILNGNNYLDLGARIVLESGASIGPGTTIMTHNGYNSNPFLVERLPHTVGFKPVTIKSGANVKAHALIVMGVTVGADAVVAGGSVVNVDVPDRHLVAGVPARVVTEVF